MVCLKSGANRLFQCNMSFHRYGILKFKDLVEFKVLSIIFKVVSNISVHVIEQIWLKSIIIFFQIRMLICMSMRSQ